jgi:2-oxo-4-hydroxy-4-carboxy-5-ureidoimidazoline decarboxylase
LGGRLEHRCQRAVPDGRAAPDLSTIQWWRLQAAADGATRPFKGQEEMLTIDRINHMEWDEFVSTLGPVFENSPWIARGTWNSRPFVNAEELHRAMFDQVLRCDVATRMEFLRVHPDLAGKEAKEGRMTTESTVEQGTAGLDRLSSGEAAMIDDLNSRYRAKHGFPFIICVRHYTKVGIIAEFIHRLGCGTDIELEEALRQIANISRYRLDSILAPQIDGEIKPT